MAQEPRNAPGALARRVAVVGPLTPFRGGIAHHTTRLCRELSESTELLAVSYTRQYPRWLFPGESDQEKDGVRLDQPYARYLIDSLNPFTWRRALITIKSHAPDVVIIPWWTFFWAPCYWYLTTGFRRAGLSVRLLCHNVVDHEASWWKTGLTKAVLARSDSFVVQSERERSRLDELIPGARTRVHPHPAYEDFPEVDSPLPRRAALELLFFGLVRPYKGVDVLVEAAARVRDADVKITIAGEFWSGREEVERKIMQLGLEEVIELVPRYVSDQEAARYFTRADAVVMPYRRATGSGVLGLAYRYGKPVIVSRVDGLLDSVVPGETGIVVEPDSAAALAEAIRGLTSEQARAMRPAVERQAATMTWDSLAALLREP